MKKRYLALGIVCIIMLAAVAQNQFSVLKIGPSPTSTTITLQGSTGTVTATEFVGGGAGITGLNVSTVSDSDFRIQDNGDATKQIAFEASGIATGTDRTYTLPDASGTLALTSGLHDAVTVSGAYDYITLSGQDLVRGQVDVTTDITGTIADSQVSDTLTASLFTGSGSSTTAVDLATAEVAGDLPLANVAQIAQSTIAGRAAGASTGDITALTPLQVRTMLQTPTSVTSSSNAAAWNSDNGQTFSHTLSENTTVAASSGTEFDGQMVIFVVTQVAGGYTLAWNAEFVAADGLNASMTAVTAVNGNMSVYGFIRVEYLSQWHLVAYKELAP